MERLAEFISGRAWFIVAVWVILTIAALACIESLRIENVQAKFLPPQSDPVVRENRLFKERFGDRVVLIAGLDYGHRMRADDIRHALRVAREIEAVPGVKRLWSLVSVPRVVWDLHRPRFIPAIRGDEADSLLESRVHDLLATEPLYKGSLISLDGGCCGMVIEVGSEGTLAEGARQAIAARIDRILSISSAGRCRSALTGAPLLNRALEASTRRDLRIFGLLSAVIVVGLLAILYRHPVPVVLAVAVALTSLVWSLGLLPLSERPLSASLAMVVPLVLVISVAYSSHYLAHFFGPAARETTPTGRFRRMLEAAFIPGLLCGFTTVLGFASLAASRLEAIQELGGLMACAVLISTALNSILLPSLLWLFGSRRSGAVRVAALPGDIADRMAKAASGRPRLVLALACLIALVLGIGVSRLMVSANPLHFFTSDSEVRRAYELIDQRLGGSLPLELIVERGRTDLTGLVSALERTEQRLRSLEEVGWVSSGLDALLMAERVRPPMAAPLVNLRADRMHSGAWRRLLENPATAGFVYADSSNVAFRVSARLQAVDAARLRVLLDEVRSIAGDELSGERVTLTGQAPLLLRTHEYVVNSLVRSFAVAFVPIFVLFALLSRSWLVGGAAAAANLLPLIAVIGAMGWLGIPLDISTSMIASIALGIIVDDTIHFVFRYRRRPQGIDTGSAIRAIHHEIGPPTMVTLMVMTAGFLVLAPSSFAPTRNFGWLSALTLCSASLGDMLVLPAMLVAFTRVRRGSKLTAGRSA